MSYARTIKYCLSSSSLTPHARTLFLVHARHPARTLPPRTLTCVHARTLALPRPCNLTTHTHHTVTPVSPSKSLVQSHFSVNSECGTFSWCFHSTDHVDRVGVQSQRRHEGRPPAPVSTTRGKDNHHTSSLTTTRAPFPALTSVTFANPNINVPPQRRC